MWSCREAGYASAVSWQTFLITKQTDIRPGFKVLIQVIGSVWKHKGDNSEVNQKEEPHQHVLLCDRSDKDPTSQQNGSSGPKSGTLLFESPVFGIAMLDKSFTTPYFRTSGSTLPTMLGTTSTFHRAHINKSLELI
eukprot:m.96008 g.96008  ORF g.96008 m.96008 type:complete len:136 (-) comp12347_c0_seq2:300-707(-)